MGTHQTAEETRQCRVDKMGPELGELHDDLFTEVAWLHLKWAHYRELFVESSEQTALFNRIAPLFFARLDDILFDDIILHISRLTDPPVYTQKTNQRKQKHYRLSLKCLVELIPNDGLRKQVGQEVGSLCAMSDIARDWRHRLLAHCDLLTVRDQNPRPRPGASRHDIEEILASMRRVMNLVYAHFCDTEDAYCFVGTIGGPSELVRALELADPAKLDKQEKRRDIERLKRPSASP